MKTQIFAFAIAILMAGTISMSCESAAQKETATEADDTNTKHELKEAQQVTVLAAQKAATAEEWKAFKSATDEAIATNEKRIAELKVQLEKRGKTLDKAYAKRIEDLEQENKEFKARLVTYEKDQSSEWDSFKRELNHDMDRLGKALKDFTMNNTD